MSSGFITEEELEEKRRIRQEEWEKVRQPNDPTEAPEETYDRRTLFERLEEQKQKKEMEYEEAHKLKNMVKGLDDDEVDFLDMVDRKKIEQGKQLKLEEAKELEEYRKKVAALKQKRNNNDNGEMKKKAINPFENICTSFSKEKMPVNKVSVNIGKKRPNSSEELAESKEKKIVSSNNSSHSNFSANCPSSRYAAMRQAMTLPSARKCIGVLPGIGSYISEDSDDSENTSGSDIEDFCVTRRLRVKK